MDMQDQKRVGDLTVAEARLLVKQAVRSGIKLWLMVSLALPLGIFAVIALAGFILYPK